jgi:xanthine dehydrogenase large subunit
MKVFSSAQSPGTFHKHIAEVLGIPMHKVELDIRRLGGGFGGKESTAIWISASAVAAKLLNKPVKIVLERNDDISTSGKRHRYIIDYKIGLNKDYIIKAYEVDLYQQAGAFCDISLAVLGRSFLHTTSAYNIENLKATAVSCRTNIPPNNAFRGFGVPQGVFAIESAISHVSEIAGVEASFIKQKNLLSDGDVLPYGLKLEKVNCIKCWDELDKKADIESRIKKINEYNRNNTVTKKGYAVTPVCFGISFAQTALNQASSLVNIYIDGTVSVSTGAVEMGQGVNTKLALIAARTFSIDPKKVRVDSTNTSRIPNASPTSASTGADLNGMAVKTACEEILERLKKFGAKKFNKENKDDISIKDEYIHLKGEKTDYGWEKLVFDAYWDRTDLSSHSYYATPGLYMNTENEKGRPFAYYSYGASLIEVTVDCLRGTYEIEYAEIIHDVGQSLSPEIDKGQTYGAALQGIGWSTIETLKYSSDGKLLTGMNAYKIPDIKFCPDNFNVTLLENSFNPYAICNSKAVGEPPFIHGLGAYFAILYALRNIRKDKPIPPLPLTPEKVFMYIHGGK